jgi:hypothetical protein
MIKTETLALIGKKIGLHTQTIKSFFNNRLVPKQQHVEMTTAIDDLITDYATKLNELKTAKSILKSMQV